MADSHKVSSGVQKLINRLRNEGVRMGENEADRLIHEAKEKASQILDEAKEEAEQIRTDARQYSEKEKKAAENSLKLAYRDTILKLKSDITEHFAAQVKELVALELEDKNFLREVILAIAGHANTVLERDQKMILSLSKELFEKGENNTDPHDPVAQEKFQHFLKGVSGEMLREGVELALADDQKPGIRLTLKDQEVEINLTEETLSQILLEHLLPKFRAFLEGLKP